MTANERRLQAQVNSLSAQNAKQAETITGLRQQVQERGRIIKKQDGEKRALSAMLEKVQAVQD